MEIQIKKAIKAGNSSAVILPRSWLDKEVRVEIIKKTPEVILSDVIGVVKSHINPSDIIGIYLTGSYARGDEDANSDIDILIVTKDIDKEMVYEGIYNILVVSSELINQKLKIDLFPIGQMLKEAKPLLNAPYLYQMKEKVKVTKENVEWYLTTTESKLGLIRQVLDLANSRNKRYIDDVVAYTLVLRIRTLYIINKLIKNENYSKKDFIRMIKNVSKGANAYERYLAVKDNKSNPEEEKGIGVVEAERLYEYLRNELASIKRVLKV